VDYHAIAEQPRIIQVFDSVIRWLLIAASSSMIEAAQIRLIELIPIGRQPISLTMSRLSQARKRTRSHSVPSRSLGVTRR
jgi:hypothetical protein